MFDSLLRMYHSYLEASASNPVVASVVTLYGAGLLTWVLRSVPSRISSFIALQLTTTLRIDNGGWFRLRQYVSFHKTLIGMILPSLVRSYQVEVDRDTEQVFLGPGPHKCFFVFKGRLFWVQLVRLPSNGAEIEKKELVIKGITRSTSIINELVDKLKCPDLDEGIKFHVRSNNEWVPLTNIMERKLETVILKEELKASICKELEEFGATRDWYLDRGISHKRVILLEGPPGTGKTSLVRALATKYKRDVFSVDLSMTSNYSIQSVFLSVKKGSFILIEDFDDSPAVQARRALYKAQIDQDQEERTLRPAVPSSSAASLHEGQYEGHHASSMLTLSAVLNVLDGFVGLDDVVVFMATNKERGLDSALLRTGRIDSRYYLGLLESPEVHQFFRVMYPQYELPKDAVFKPIVGSDLFDLFISNKRDPEACYQKLLAIQQPYLRKVGS